MHICILQTVMEIFWHQQFHSSNNFEGLKLWHIYLAQNLSGTLIYNNRQGKLAQLLIYSPG